MTALIDFLLKYALADIGPFAGGGPGAWTVGTSTVGSLDTIS